MKKLVSVALAAAALAAPAAIASAQGNDHRAKGPRTVEYVFGGVVADDSSEIAVDLNDVRGLSRDARRSLAGASSVTIKLAATTRFVRRTGLHTMQIVLTAPVSVSKLKVGDRVRVLIRAPRGLAAANLPAAQVVVVRGPAPGAAVTPTTDPVVTPPAPEPAPPVVAPLPDPILL